LTNSVLSAESCRMAGQFTEDFFCVYSFSFSFVTNHADARDSFLRLYRRFVSSGTRGAAQAVVEHVADGFIWRFKEETVATSLLGSALLGLESALCEAIIRSQDRSIAVHAATLYSVQSAVMLTGSSGAGKSTLSFALSQRGLTVASDDVALVETETLSVHPIPRPFHLDEQSLLLLETASMQLPQLRIRPFFVAPFDVDERSIPRWQPELLIYIGALRAASPEVKRVSQSEMAAYLLSETAQGPVSDSETVRVLTKICSGASCFALVPGPFSQTVDLVADLILGRQTELTASRVREGEIATLE
jgi:hypothetical protein